MKNGNKKAILVSTYHQTTTLIELKTGDWMFGWATKRQINKARRELCTIPRCECSWEALTEEGVALEKEVLGDIIIFID